LPEIARLQLATLLTFGSLFSSFTGNLTLTAGTMRLQAMPVPHERSAQRHIAGDL
jgi:hypothetical protein